MNETSAKNIVILDDDKYILKFLDYTITKAGYNCIPISDANEIFTTLEKNKPELLILDVLMPGIDGFSIAEKIKNDEKYSSVKILISTAIYKKEKYEEAAKKIGVEAYIRKPIQKEELLDKIQQIIGTP
jgi:DNA-binding response OmpR family regulator